MCSVRPEARISEEEPRTRLKLHVYGNIMGMFTGYMIAMVCHQDGMEKRWEGGASSEQTMLLYVYIYFFGIFCCFHQKKLCFVICIIFISFFDEVSNFRNRILTNQKPELTIRNCPCNRISPLRVNPLSFIYSDTNQFHCLATS